MLTRIFGQITSSTTIIIGLFALIVSGLYFFFGETPSFLLVTAWGDIVFTQIAGYIVYGFGILGIMFGLQWILEYKFKLVKRHAYLAFFTVILLLVFLPFGQLNLLFELNIFLLILYSWLEVYQGDKLLGRSLNTGILVAFCSLIDVRMSWLLPFSYVVYLVFGRLTLRTAIILLVGFGTIWLNALFLEFIIFDTTVVWEYFKSMFTANEVLIAGSLPIAQTIVLGAMLIPALFEFVNVINRAAVFKRQTNIILLTAVGLSVFSYFIYGFQTFQIVIILPLLTILFVNYFQFVKRVWLQEIILWLSLIVLVLFDLNLV